MESLFSYVEGEKRRTETVRAKTSGPEASSIALPEAKTPKKDNKPGWMLRKMRDSNDPAYDKIVNKHVAMAALKLPSKKTKVNEAINKIINKKFKDHVNTDPKLKEPNDKEVVGTDKKGLSRTEKTNIGKYAQRT